MSDFMQRAAPHAQFAVSQKAAKLIRRPEVEARTGLSRSTLYSWMKEGRFPQPVKLGARIVAWRESDVTEWLETRETRGAA